MMDFNKLRHPSGFLKIIELCLLVLIMALYFSQGIYVMYGWTQFVSAVIIGSFVNAIILLTVMLMGYDQLQKTPLELLLYTFYGVSFFVSAVLLFTVSNGPWIAAGLFCLIILAVYCADWYFAFISLNGHPPPLFPGAPSTGQQQTFANPAYQADSGVESYQAGSGATIGVEPYQPYQPYQQPPDTVDLGPPRQSNPVFQTNPVYPTTMNYPPANLHVDIPPEFPT